MMTPWPRKSDVHMITFQMGPFRRSLRMKLKTTGKRWNEKHCSETNSGLKDQRPTDSVRSFPPFTSGATRLLREVSRAQENLIMLGSRANTMSWFWHLLPISLPTSWPSRMPLGINIVGVTLVTKTCWQRWPRVLEPSNSKPKIKCKSSNF